jgi:parallel beta-helix repeat protein
MKRAAILPLSLLAFLVPGMAESAVACDRVAAPSGSDSASGTAQAPFRTAQQLVRSLGSGQTGCLRAGTFSADEEVIVDRPGITLKSFPNERATLRTRLWVSAEGSGSTVSDLNLDGRNPRELPSPTVNAADVTFRNNDVTNHHTAICFALGNPEYGRATRTLLEGNQIHNCGLMPAQNHDHGIYVEASTGVIIRNNWIYDNADRGIQLYPDADNTTITGNVIDGNGQGIIFSGIGQRTSDNNVVERNVISNSVVRHNVESYYDDGDAVGKGNVVRQNCIKGARGWYGNEGGGMGVQSPQTGFTARENLAKSPQFVNRSAHNFALAPGSDCARLLGGQLTIGISLKAAKNQVKTNAALPVTGTTSGAQAGDQVTIAIRAGKGWRSIGRARLAADGRFKTKVRVKVPRSVTRAKFRATVAGLGDSKPVAVKVKTRR